MEAITAFMESFDIAKLLPELGKFISDLRFWLGLFMLVGPVLMLLLGLWYFFLPTKEANHHVGFRSYFGMGSPDAWKFTQKRAGLLFMIGGGVLTVASIVLLVVLSGAEPMKMATTAVIVLLAQAVVAFSLWLTMQITLLIRYDKQGNKKTRG